MEVWARSVFAALMVINSAASVAGNLLVLLLLLLNKELQTESAALSLSLSLCDLGLGLTVLPLAAHSSLGDSTPSQAALCQARGFLFLLLQTASLNSLAWLTLHRFSQICLPLRYSRWWTGGRTLGALLLLWTFCLLNAALPLLGVGRYAYSPTMFLCSPSMDPASRGFGLYVLLLGVLLPLGSVCVLQGCMAATARRQARRGTFTCNHDHCFYVPASGYTRTAGLLLATSGQSIPPAYRSASSRTTSLLVSLRLYPFPIGQPQSILPPLVSREHFQNCILSFGWDVYLTFGTFSISSWKVG